MADQLEETPLSVLAVFAHPDDPEVACGGALHKWASAGADVRVVIANRGDKGSWDATKDPDELAAERAVEVAAALDALGVPSWTSLGIEDGEAENTSELRGLLVQEIRTHRPDVVVAPDPTAAFFGDTYVNHGDHRAVGWAAVDAVAPAAASPLYYPEAGDAHQVATLLLAGSLEPDVWVDISDDVDVKILSVQCHSSQVGDPAFVAEAVRQRAADVGAEVGVGAAEMFRRLRLG